MLVIKRDNKTREEFDITKIIIALEKAIKASSNKISSKDLQKLVNEIYSQITNLNKEEISVEQIQDIVEDILIQFNFSEIAKKYITYRYEHNKVRNKLTLLESEINEALNCTNVQNSNANVDENSFGGRRLTAANILLKDLALEKLISKEVSQAYKDNYIYIHDLDSYALGNHNCCFIDFEKLFKDGFITRNGDVRKPNSLSTAMQLVAVIMQCQSQVQFGGVASAHIDDDLAPFVDLSYKKYYKLICPYFNKEYPANDSEIKFKSSFDNEVEKFAYEMTLKEAKQSAEGLYHNLNTLESRAGSQVPFSSINFGLNTTPQGRLITKCLLEASIAGIGKYNTTPIFPISIFKYKKGINANIGDPNYDLKLLALKSLSKRIYPNFVNCDWSQNIAIDKDSEMATMGALAGVHKFSIKIEDKEFDDISIRDAFTIINKLTCCLSSLKGNYSCIKDLPFKVYVKSLGEWHQIKGLIYNSKNCPLELYKINYIKNEEECNFIVTEDHPFPIGRRRVFTRDLKIGDNLYSFNKKEKYPIISIEKLDKKEETFDFEVDNDLFDVDGILTHNCRTIVGKDRFGLGYTKVGRGNISPITINLPKIGIEYGICLGDRDKADLRGFWNKLDDVLKITEKGLVDRFNYIAKQQPSAGPFMYQNGTMKDAQLCKDSVYNMVKHGTQAIGFIGLAETLQALFGKNQLDKQVREFGLHVVSHIYDYAKQASERNNLNFSCYFTPAEGCCYTIMQKLQKEFGFIKNVTENSFLTNSIHIPVWEKISIFDKISIESEFTKYGTGGCITYVEFDSKIKDNLQAIEQVINFAMNKDIPYLAINFPIDTCLDCGYQDQITDRCPVCNSTNIEHLARVTGYLSSDVKNFNKGKQEEVSKRFKHSLITF